MTTQAEFHGALARLQDNPSESRYRVSAWLDANERDVLVLLGRNGNSSYECIAITADLLGINRRTLETWRYLRRKRKQEMKAMEVVR